MKNILKKLLAISKEVEAMPKDKTNDFQNYKYLSETQVSLKMRQLLNEHGVIFTHSVKQTGMKDWQNSKGAQKFLTTIEVTYRFYDAETGEFIEGTECGQGEDSGDKGVYKAVTGAVKYIFMKNFLIPTGDDPENTQHTVKPVTAKVKTASTTSKLVPCNICGADYKLVPGGISKKTGNHYDAFYSCSTRGCKAKTFKQDEANMMLKPEYRVANIMDGQVDDGAPPPTLDDLPY